ncbi:MAG: peptide chain release factor N(5)-glutamine methyltransferase [Xanthobacteraceae bacterium]|nr:peptide chain release factor N(5)-glutamine methyltransferase [Xanthobacteraceae bacterium]
MTLTGHTVEQARRAVSAELNAANIETPDLDARTLLGGILKLDLTGLMTAYERELNDGEAAELANVVQRRISGEPVARILGCKEFWGLPLALSPATLVPRPDTETAVEAALTALKRNNRSDDRLRIADLGTGTGAILLALLSELPNAEGIGTDINPDALATAQRNAQSLGLGARAAFVQSDYAAALDGPFDLIISNPPYIASGDIDGLALEVRAHDPHVALDGGVDGLDAYRAIVPQARQLLKANGILVVEIGQGQEVDVARIMAAAGLESDGLAIPDINGIGRVLTARNP